MTRAVGKGERVAIVGSREYPDLEAVRSYIRYLPSNVIIVTGGALGVDTIAEKTANYLGNQCEVYEADWNKHGRAAGPIRNKLIVDNCDRVVAFWDGKSPGTKNTIELARKAGKPVEVITAMTAPEAKGGR